MILPDHGNLLPHVDVGQRAGKASQSLKNYDNLAGAAMLRRSGRARGDAHRYADTEDRVGRQLKDFYQSLLRQPVPERLIALMDSLEAQEGR